MGKWIRFLCDDVWPTWFCCLVVVALLVGLWWAVDIGLDRQERMVGQGIYSQQALIEMDRRSQ